MKKILALVLVLSLVLGTFSFAFADAHLPSDIVGEDSEEAVATLMALGVVNGYPDGTYKPERAVTRAEMAKLLVEALGYGELSMGATTTFPDVQGTWAERYVAFAASMDIVVGYPDGTFRPSQTMTVEEALTMVVRAIGYTEESLTGTWPTNYKVKALDLGLTDDMSALSGPGLRGDVAILLFNALQVRLVEVDADNAVTYVMNNDDTYRLFIDRIGKKVADATIAYDDVWGDDALDTLVDLEQYLFHTITYYENKDGDVAYVSDMDTSEFAGVLTSTSEGAITVDNPDDDMDFTDFLLDEDDDFDFGLFYNGVEDTNTDLWTYSEDETVEARVIYDDDDVVQGVVVWESVAQQINREYTDRRPTEIDGIELPEDADGDLDMSDLTIEGDATTLEDIEVDDVVHVYSSEGRNIRTNEDPDKLRLLVVRDTFTGTLTEIDGDTFTFDGVEFEASVYSSVSFDAETDLGDDFDLFLDKDGNIFAYEEASEAAAAEGYGVYIGKKDGTTTTETPYQGDPEEVIDDAPTVKIFTSGGDPVVYDLYTGDLTLGTVSVDGLGSLKVEDDGNGAITVVEDSDLEFRSLVKYELNSDDEITSIETVGASYGSTDVDSDDNTIDTYDVRDNTIVFDVEDSDEDEWTVVSSQYATDSTAGEYYEEDFDIVAMTATSGISSTTGTYGIVTNVANYYDGSDTVEKVTALVNGETETYITNGDNDIAPEDKVVKLSFDGELLEDVTEVSSSPSAVNLVKITSVDSQRVRFDGDDNDPVTVSGTYAFADDATVYIVEDETTWTAETVDYLRSDDIVKLYLNEDSEVIVVVIDVDQEQANIDFEGQ